MKAYLVIKETLYNSNSGLIFSIEENPPIFINRENAIKYIKEYIENRFKDNSYEFKKSMIDFFIYHLLEVEVME